VGTTSGIVVVFSSSEEVLCALGSVAGEPVVSIDLFPRTNLLAVGHADGSVVLWNYFYGTIVAKLDNVVFQKENKNIRRTTDDSFISSITNIKFINADTLIATDAMGAFLMYCETQYLTNSVTLSFERIKNAAINNIMDVIVMPNSNILLLTYDNLFILNPNTEQVSMGPDRPNKDVTNLTNIDQKRTLSHKDPMMKNLTSDPADKTREKIYKPSFIMQNPTWNVQYDPLPCMAALQYRHNFVVKEEESNKYVNKLDEKYSLVVSWGTDLYVYNEVLSNNFDTNTGLELHLQHNVVSVSWVSPNVITLIDSRNMLLLVDPTGRPRVVQEYNLPALTSSVCYGVSGVLKMKDIEKSKLMQVYVELPDYRKSVVQSDAILYTLGAMSLTNVRVLSWAERLDNLIKQMKWKEAFTMAFEFRDNEQSCVVGLPNDEALRFKMTSDRIETEIPHYLHHALATDKESIDSKLAHNAGHLCISYALDSTSKDGNQIRVDQLIFTLIYQIYHEHGKDGVFHDLILEFVAENKLTFIRNSLLPEFLHYHLVAQHKNKASHIIAVDEVLSKLDISLPVLQSAEDGPFSETYLAKKQLYATSVHSANFLYKHRTPASASFYIDNLRNLIRNHGNRIHSIRKSDIVIKYISRYLQLQVPMSDLDSLELKRLTLEFIFEHDLAIFKLCTREYEKTLIQIHNKKYSFYNIIPYILKACFDMDLGALQKTVILPCIKHAAAYMHGLNKKMLDHTPSIEEVRDSTTTPLYIAIFFAQLLTSEFLNKGGEATDLVATENVSTRLSEYNVKDMNSSFMMRARSIEGLRQEYKSFMKSVNKYLELKMYVKLPELDTNKFAEDSAEYRMLVVYHMITFTVTMLINHVRVQDIEFHTEITRNIVQREITNMISQYRFADTMPIILQNLQFAIIGDGEEQEPLFEVASHMYANIEALADENQRNKMRVWYLRVFYPRYVKDMAVEKFNYEQVHSDIIQDVNKDAIDRLVDSYIESILGDPDYTKAQENVNIWMQDVMRNPNAIQSHKLFMYKYVEKELETFPSGPKGLRELCRAKNLIYDEFFNFYLRLFCAESHPSKIKPFLETHAKKIKSSNDRFEVVMVLCKDVPEAKAFLLEMKGDIHGALNEFIREMYTYRARLQSLVLENSQIDNINVTYLMRKVDSEERVIDMIVDDFDLVTENRFVFSQDSAYSDQEKEMRMFMHRKKMVKLPPISLRKRLIQILEPDELPSLRTVAADIVKQPIFVYERKDIERVRSIKVQQMLSGVKAKNADDRTKTIMLQTILELMREPSIQPEQTKDLVTRIEELKKKLAKSYDDEQDHSWQHLCEAIIEREEHDILFSAEFNNIRNTVRNAITLCQVNSDRNTLDDAQVKKLWEKLLDQFMWLMHELRNKAVKIAARIPKKTSLETRQVKQSEEGFANKRAQQAEELERLLADSDSETEDDEEQNEVDNENISIYDAEIDDIEKYILDSRKALVDLTHKMELLKTVLISENGKPTMMQKRKKKIVTDTSQQQGIVRELTEYESRISQKKQHLEDLNARRNELEEKKQKRKREIAEAHRQVESMNALANLWMQRCLSVLLFDIMSVMIKYVDVPVILKKITNTVHKKEDTPANNQFQRLRSTVMRILTAYRYERILLTAQSAMLATDIFQRGTYYFEERTKGISLAVKLCEICDGPMGGPVIDQGDLFLDFESRLFCCGHSFHRDCCESEVVRVCPFCHQHDTRNRKIEIDDDDVDEKTVETRKSSEEIRAAKIERDRLELELRSKGRIQWRVLDPLLERGDRLGTLDHLIHQIYQKQVYDRKILELDTYMQQLTEQKETSSYSDRVATMIKTFNSQKEDVKTEFQNNRIKFSNSMRLEMNCGMDVSNVFETEYQVRREKKLQNRLNMFHNMFAYVMPFEDKRKRHEIKVLITSNGGKIVSAFSDVVSHVIAEGHFACVKDYKKLESERKLVVVPQEWVRDCVKEKKIQNPRVWQYLVTDKEQDKKSEKVAEENVVQEGNTVTHVKRIKFEKAEPLVDIIDDE
jgi:hypothetical protein